MTNLTMKDSAYPSTGGPVTDIILIYIGGDTPHPWSNADIDSQPERYRLPTWVRSDPTGYNGTTEAGIVAAWLRAHGVPSRKSVVLDLEISADVGYVNAFNLAMRAAGYKTMKYGSMGTIWNNPQTDGGTFVADPTGI